MQLYELSLIDIQDELTFKNLQKLHAIFSDLRYGIENKLDSCLFTTVITSNKKKFKEFSHFYCFSDD